MEEVKENLEGKDNTFEGNYIEKFQGHQEEEFYPGQLISWERKFKHVILYAANSVLEISIITPTILKFRYANDGYFEDDFSYAIDPAFDPAPTLWELSELADSVCISTAKLKCFISKDDFGIKITDLSGAVVMEDEKGYHWKNENRFGGNVVISTIKSDEDAQYFGLGDKTGRLNLKGSRRELWGTDCYGYGNDTDPVYKNIPFFLSLRKQVGFGIFLDNSFRTFFDFGHERPEAVSYWAQGGEMRYYFIYGPELLSVTQQYAMLTGKPQLPPKWSLGYHQSKWSYYPESNVRKLAKTFRDLKIPCDVIHLDIDYMDGYRCFTWDHTRFPDPQKMISDLKADGFKSIVIIDPGIKIDKHYKVYQQGMHYDYFCKRMDGAKFVGSVWPGPCHFPDFTNPNARKWWAGLFEGLMKDGVAGVWNDMNEPAVFETGTFPRDIRHNYDGHPCSHRKGHNVYGMQMARATHEGQQHFKGNERAFTITRSAYAGIQRYSSAWTGDNMATWEHLQIANVQCQRLAASGVSFVGSDVGGFIGSPSGELYTRWIQMAVFHPFFRTHSSGDHGDKEPWVFEKTYLANIKRFIEFRYELMPYIYTSFWQHATIGTPMLRSLHMEDQTDEETYYREEEFMMGDHLLVCPVSTEAITERLMYFTQGTWYHFWSDKVFAGKQEHTVPTPLHEIPLFVRAGAVIPMQPVMQYVDEFAFDTLTLHVYHGVDTVKSYLYEDDGKTLDYQTGAKCVKTFTQTKKSLKQDIQGNYETSYKQYELILHGFPTDIQYIEVDGQQVSVSKDRARELTVQIDKYFREINF